MSTQTKWGTSRTYINKRIKTHNIFIFSKAYKGNAVTILTKNEHLH